MHQSLSKEDNNTLKSMITMQNNDVTYCHIGDSSIFSLKLIEEIRIIVLGAKKTMGKMLYDGMIYEFEDLISSAAQDPDPKDEELLWREAYKAWKNEEEGVTEDNMIDFWLLQDKGGYNYFHSLFYTQFFEDEYKYDVECYQQLDIIKGLMTLSSGVGFDSAKMMYKVNTSRYANDSSPTYARHMPIATRKDLLESLSKHFPSNEDGELSKI